MSDETLQQGELDELLARCLEQPESEWSAAIECACRERPELAMALVRRFEVLREHGLLTASPPSPSGDPARLPRDFGDFRLLRLLGSGGMGLVYHAYWKQREREVAVKLLGPLGLSSPAAQRRFRRELEIAADFRHPSVCEVYEVGREEGAQYIAMRYIAGPTLAEEISEASAAPGIDRILLQFEDLARALHAAHERGLVHRDVKPANVLIDGERALPVDFGLARYTDASRLTQPDARLGTPAYMAPETFRSADEASPRSDVYSLGATLFERLTLQLPFEAATWEGLAQRITNEPTPDLRRLRPELPKDLGTVVRTAMAKDADHRYRSAEAFADDLAAVRAGAPIAARAPSLARRARSWTRRNPLASALGVGLLAGLASVLWLQLSLRTSLREARALNLAELSDPTETGDPELSVLLARRGVELFEHPITVSRLQAVLADFHPSRLIADWGRAPRAPFVLRFSQDGARLLAGEAAGELRLFELTQEQTPQLGSWRLEGASIRTASIAPDGRRVLAVLSDWTARAWSPDEGETVLARDVLAGGFRSADRVLLRVLAADTPRARASPPTLAGSLELDVNGRAVALEASQTEGSWSGAIVTADGARVFAWDTSQRVSVWESGGRRLTAWKPTGPPPRSLDVSPDGRFAAFTIPQDDTFVVRLWDVTRQMPDTALPADSVRSVLFGPCGDKLLTIHGDESLRVWNVDGELLTRVSAQNRNVLSACFDPRGERILVANGDGVARLYDTRGVELAAFRGHTGHVLDAAFHPKGETLVTSSYDGTLRLWSVAPSSDHAIANFPDAVRTLDLAADGALLVGTSGGSAWRLAHAAAGSEAIGIGSATGPGEGAFHDVRFAADGAGILTLDRTGTVRIYGPQAELSLELNHLASQTIAGHAAEGQLDRSPDGRMLLTTLPPATGSEPNAVALWTRSGAGGEWERRTIETPGPALSVAFAPDGRHFAAAGRDAVGQSARGWFRIWDRTGAPLPSHKDPQINKPADELHNDWIRCVRFAPDGQRLVTASRDNTARIWSLRKPMRAPLVLGPHAGTVSFATFSPDGRTVATASTDGTIRLWSSTGDERAVLRGHRGMVWTLAFAPDGARLFSGSFDGTVRAWNLRTEDLLDQARGLVPRELSDAERSRYAELELR